MGLKDVLFCLVKMLTLSMQCKRTLWGNLTYLFSIIVGYLCYYHCSWALYVQLWFCDILLSVLVILHSSGCIRESWLSLFLGMPRVGSSFVIIAFPGHTISFLLYFVCLFFI